MTTRKDVIEYLEQSYGYDEYLAVAIWSIDNVLERAKERGIKLKRLQAEDILEDIDNNQEAKIGINWDVIDAYTDKFLDNKVFNEADQMKEEA